MLYTTTKYNLDECEEWRKNCASLPTLLAYEDYKNMYLLTEPTFNELLLSSTKHYKANIMNIIVKRILK